ncbi:hypothetical protein ABIE52_006768 [Rhodococcus sp. OAS809]|uniref:hypothetical protein n=1 Tax=Rhodococcus sp. OAS809 TaxID=2663874 RepID=UPI001789EB6C
MARVRQTVVAVVHGSDEGSGVDVEVYPYDLEAARGRKARQLVASWRPQPGELDDAGQVNARLHALQTVPGYSMAPTERAASGFLTKTNEQNIAFARTMSGDGGCPVYDETYEYQVGEILVFDAEVDIESLTVDWTTAVPHPSTDPETVWCEGPVQRFDGAIVDPGAFRDQMHGVHAAADGTMWPINEAGQRVLGRSEPEQEDYAAADRPQSAPTPSPASSGEGLSRGMDSLLGGRGASSTTTGTRSGRQALAAITSRTAVLVKEHGPTLVKATKSKLRDPAIQTALRNAMLTAVEVGLASKGGGAVKFAKAANTAIRVGDMVATTQGSQLGRGDRGFGR